MQYALKLAELRRPEEVGRMDGSKYYFLHRYLGHTTKDSYAHKGKM